MRTVICSYPRSGSNFLEYCLDHLTSKEHRIGKTHGHYFRFWEGKEVSGGSDKVILMLRNYKECIPRHTSKYDPARIKEYLSNQKPVRKVVKVDTSGRKYGESDYIALVDFFDEYEGEKLVIHYEDFIDDTPGELRRVCDFLGDTDERSLERFLENLDQHREISRKKYSTFAKASSFSSNQKPPKLYHSLKMGREERKKIDSHLKDKFPSIYSKYLKRYSEV